MFPHRPHSRTRPHSRQGSSSPSTTTTSPDSVPDSLRSWSMNAGRPSASSASGTGTATSTAWSDDDAATVHPPYRAKWRGMSPAGERPLIELDSGSEAEFAAPADEANGEGARKGSTGTGGTKPSEELRRLLRQMEDEVKSSTPVQPITRSPIKRPLSLPTLPPAPVQGPASPPPNQTRRANWREGRRIGVYPPVTDGAESSPERSRATNEEEEESPPTPPVRITNPYLYSARKVSDPGASSQTKPRISSRAAVLQNSISRSPPPEISALAHSPTPLETFIATHPVPSDPSSSRSPISYRSSPSSQSRKGKERAAETSVPPMSHGVRRFETRPHWSDRDSASEPDTAYQNTPPRTVKRPSPNRPRRTPRRVSVDLAPETSQIFAEEAGGLEMHGGLDLDLDEGESGNMGRPWGSESDMDSQGDDVGYTEADVQGGEGRADALGYGQVRSHRQASASFDRTERAERTARASPPAPVKYGQHASPPTANRSKDDSSRLTRILQVERSFQREDSADVSLPQLPDLGDEVDAEEAQGTSLSERRTALFRSGSGSRSSLSPRPTDLRSSSPLANRSRQTSSSSPNLSRRSDQVAEPSSRYDTPERSRTSSAHEASVSHSRSDSSLLLPPTAFPTPPIRVGLTLTPPGPGPVPKLETIPPPASTPTRQPTGDTITATPHPPGWLARSNRSVRFSPLRKTDQDWSMTNSSKDDEVSIHRLRLSPAKPSPTAGSRMKSPLSLFSSSRSQEEVDPDQSFTARVASYFVPRPSTTWKDASADLDRARRASELAQLKVEESRAAWMDALGQLRDSAVPVVRQGAGWSNWAWWFCVEMLLLWGVFRVTLDYAASLHPAANSFHTQNLHSGAYTTALSARLPAALSAFVVRRDSANFFDLMERYQVWHRIEGILDGMQSPSVGLGGMRMVGGVPS